MEHGIRETSREDARFCEVLCESLQIPCAVRHVNAPEKAKAEGISLEDAARRLRYEAFEEEADRLGFSFDKIKEKENIARDESSIGTEPIIEVK